MNPKNLTSLKKSGTIFYLNAPLDVIYKRVKDDAARPLVNVPNPRVELEKIYKERLPLYEQAHFTIDTSNVSIEGPLVQILSKV